MTEIFKCVKMKYIQKTIKERLMNKIRKLILFILTMVICVSFVSCSNPTEESGEGESHLWDSAMYKEDTSFGDGGKNITVKVVADGKIVVFTIKTDSDNLEAALLEHNLISGEKGDYGLYVKIVNGIKADYDTDKAYWALTKDGQSTTEGVSGTKISDGDIFELTYIKQVD